MRGMVRSWAAVTMLTLAVAVSATACTSSADDEAPNVAGGQGNKKEEGKAQDPQDVAASYEKCMRDQGHEVTVDELGRVGAPAGAPGGEGRGVDEGLMSAIQKCDKEVPGMKQLKEKGDAGKLKQARGMADCLRKNGIPSMPDPDPKTGALSVPKDAAGEKWTKAMGVCGDKFPGAGFIAEKLQ